MKDYEKLLFKLNVKFDTVYCDCYDFDEIHQSTVLELSDIFPGDAIIILKLLPLFDIECGPDEAFKSIVLRVAHIISYSIKDSYLTLCVEVSWRC